MKGKPIAKDIKIGPGGSGKEHSSMYGINREDDEKLIYVSTVEEYALLHSLRAYDVLRLFKKNSIEDLLRSQYDVLHTLDISDTVSMVESVLGRVNA